MEVVADRRVKARAQSEIQQMLADALQGLESQPPNLNGATLKLRTASQRYQEATNQNPWLAVFIAAWMAASLGAAAWFIFQEELWPSARTVSARDIVSGATLWGVAGASIDALRELHTRSARQQFEPTRFLWYLAHPIIGGGLGAIVFLLVLAGLLTTGQNQVLTSTESGGGFNATLPYLFAALVGFEEETLITYLRHTVRQIFQVGTGLSDEEGG